MIDIEKIKKLLADRNLQVVARETGVSPSTLYRIRSGEEINPSYDTVKKIVHYFEKQEEVLNG